MIWQSQEFDLTVEEAEEYAAQIGSLITISEVYGGLPSGGNSGDIIIKNSEEDYDASWYAPASVVEDGNGLPVTSEAVYDAVSVKYTKPSDGIPADDLADDVHLIPSGGTIGQVLRKISNNDWDIEWNTVNDGEDGSGVWYTTARISGGENPFVRRRSLIGREGATVQVHDLLFAPDVGHDGEPTTLYEITSVSIACTLKRLCKMQGTDGEDGTSPIITITEITGGHRITITDEAHPDGQDFDVPDGQDGQDGTRIWWTTARVLPYGSGGGVATRQLNGVDGATPAVRDYVFAPEIEQSGEPTTLYVITRTTAVATAFDRLCSIKGANGTSPSVAITEIEGGHRVTITDETHPQGQSFDVMDGQGGSGSSDYDDLTNKPQIAGVTLSGDKSLSDLGIESKPMLVTLSWTGSGDIYTADKTYAEITNAMAAGQEVLVDWGASILRPSEPGFTWIGYDDGQILEFILRKDSSWIGIITDLGSYRTAADQDVIDRQQNTAIEAKYTKPSGGIPASDLAAGVIPTVPSNVSAFSNDAGYLTQHQDISGKLDKTQGVSHAGEFLVVGTDGDITTVTMSVWQGGSY